MSKASDRKEGLAEAKAGEKIANAEAKAKTVKAEAKAAKEDEGKNTIGEPKIDPRQFDKKE